MGTRADWWNWLWKWRDKFEKSRWSDVVKIVLGLGFIIVTILITLKPDPFVRLGYPGIFVFNALSGPGMFLLPSLSKVMNPWILSAVSALGMAVNDSVAWWVGSNAKDLTEHEHKIKNIRTSVEKYGMLALFVWSILPFPYDFVGLVAGYLRLPYWKYVLPTFLGKFVRFILICQGVIFLTDGRMELR